MKQRAYQSQEEYRAHQASKLHSPGFRDRLSEMHESRLERFRAEFAFLPDAVPVGTLALCLGARSGEEVEVLRELGYNAVGVDIAPASDLVVRADFHRLPYKDGSFGLLYSNSIDHALDLRALAREMRRVLAPDGHILLRLHIGDYGTWESLRLDGPAEFLSLLDGFEVLREAELTEPPKLRRLQVLLKRKAEKD